jgi:hypothetical protein
MGEEHGGLRQVGEGMDLKKLLNYKALKQAREIIVFVEEIADRVGASPLLILEKIVRRIKNPFLEEVVRKLRRGLPRSKAYAGIFDRETVALIEVAEKESLDVGAVFREYSRLKKTVERAFKKVSKAVRGGIAYALMVYGVGIVVTRQMKSVADQLANYPTPFEEFKTLVSYYPYLVLIFVLYALLFVVPKTSQINPIIKKVRKLFTLLNLLMIYRIAMRIGLQSPKVLEIYAKLYPEAARFVRTLPPDKRNVKGLAKLLSRYLRPEEAVLLEEAVEMGQGERFIDSLTDRYFGRIDEITDAVALALKPVNTLLTGVVALVLVGLVAKLLITTVNLMNAAQNL